MEMSFLTLAVLRLATNTKLKYLELNGNSLGVAAAEELVKGLAANKTLQKFFGDKNFKLPQSDIL